MKKEDLSKDEKQLSFVVTAQQHKALKQEALDRDITVKQLVLGKLFNNGSVIAVPQKDGTVATFDLEFITPELVLPRKPKKK